MDRTRKPQAPPVSTGEEVWQYVVMIRQAIWSVLRYWNRRRREQPKIGAFYAVVIPPVIFVLVQHLRLTVAGIFTDKWQALEPAWPLAKPLTPQWLMGLGFVVVLTVAVDWWAAAQYKRQPDKLTMPPVRADEWILGWMVERTWNPDPGEWALQKTQQLFTLTAEHLRVHLLVVAPPGAGKTFNILNPILRLCRRLQATCIVFDVKGDPVKPDDKLDYNPAEFDITIDFTRPAESTRLNLAASGDPREIGEQLGEALVYDPGADKSYFANLAKDALGGLWAAHVAAYKAHPTFRRILAYLRDEPSREDLLAELKRAGYTADSDELLDVERVKQLAESKNSDLLGNLDLALAPLARGEISQMLVTDASGVSIADLLQQGKRVRVILPVARYPRVAPIIGRLILAQYTNAVLDPACDRERLKAILVDEAHWFVTPAIASGMAQARGNFGAYVLAFQDLPQIANETLRDQIFAVAGNKLVMNGVVDYDGDKFSRLFGARERLYISRSRNISSGTSSSRSSGQAQHASGYGSQASHAASRSVSESSGESRQTRLRPDWLAAEIREMPQWHVLIERRDGQGGFTPPTLVAMDLDLQTAIRARQERLVAPSGSALPPALAAKAAAPNGALPSAPVVKTATTGSALPPTLAARMAGPPSPRVSSEPEAALVPATPDETRDPAFIPAGPTIPPLLSALAGDDLAAHVSERLALPFGDATTLVEQAHAQGWTPATILALVAEVSADPLALRPAATFRRRVLANRSPGSKEVL